MDHQQLLVSQIISLLEQLDGPTTEEFVLGYILRIAQGTYTFEQTLKYCKQVIKDNILLIENHNERFTNEQTT